jgi:hypothetical protein
MQQSISGLLCVLVLWTTCTLSRAKILTIEFTTKRPGAPGVVAYGKPLRVYVSNKWLYLQALSLTHKIFIVASFN